MEFNFDCEKLLGCENDGITIIEHCHKNFMKYFNFISLCEIIDGIGNISSVVINFLN